MFFNCNMKKDNYKYLGVGMISHSDTQMRKNMLIPIEYITKAEQAVVVKLSHKTRTFWRGEMPGERINRSGRPRMEIESAM